MTTEAKSDAADSEQAPQDPPSKATTDTLKGQSPSSQTDEPSTSEEGKEPDSAIEDSDARGHDEDLVDPAVRAKNLISNSYLSIAGDLVLGDREKLSVPVADITASIKVAETTYADPEHFAELSHAVCTPKVIVLTGAACGKRTTAGVTLLRAHHHPILQLPSDMAVRNLVGGIETLCKKSPQAGILVEAVDSKTLLMLTSFEVHRLTSVLTAGARIILTATSLSGVPQQIDGVTVVQCSSPSSRKVIERAEASPQAKQTALAALGILDDNGLSPKDTLSLLSRAGVPDQTPERLAQIFDGKATESALDQWLSGERSAKHVACLVAAASLDGAPSVDVDVAAETLAELFSADLEEPAEGTKMFRVADRGWPNGMVEVTRRSVGTHFGHHEIEAIKICPPHSRLRIVEYLWRHLGADFRRPVTEWLRNLSNHRNSGMRLGAAATAGALFTVDPVIAERELIKIWALDKRFPSRLCAATALGAPVALGADPAGARALTKSWSTSTNLNLRHVAVLAYGGLLGAWDPGSAAAAHLWRIATETPELSQEAYVSLASLMAAGGSAARVRATVIEVLDAQADLEDAPRHVYALLPLIIRYLTAPGDTPRESLEALLESPQEKETLSTFTHLFQQAFTTGAGYESARRALDVLLWSIADGRVDQKYAFALIAALRKAANQVGEADALDARVERALWANTRKHKASADVARTVIAEFYPPS